MTEQSRALMDYVDAEARQLVPRADALRPALDFEKLKRDYNEMVEYVRSIMREGIDYGEIPGTGGKPTLLKPGAEKLATRAGLTKHFVPVRFVEDWEKPFFYYLERVVLTDIRTGIVIAEAEGSANSMESKWRWRYVYPKDATDEEKDKGKLVLRKGRGGERYEAYRLQNEELWTETNSIKKMAQKRALVAGVLIACNASEFFTQDLEDMSSERAQQGTPEGQPSQVSGEGSDFRLPRGKHKGKLLKDVPVDYLDWVAKNWDDEPGRIVSQFLQGSTLKETGPISELHPTDSQFARAWQQFQEIANEKPGIPYKEMTASLREKSAPEVTIAEVQAVGRALRAWEPEPSDEELAAAEDQAVNEELRI